MVSHISVAAEIVSMAASKKGKKTGLFKNMNRMESIIAIKSVQSRVNKVIGCRRSKESG